MPVSSLPGLPLLIVASAAAIAAAVSSVLALLAVPISGIPGFRPNDATRNALMRSLVFACNLGGLVALAWSQSVVLSQAMLPALLVTAAAGSAASAGVYVQVKARVATNAAPVVTLPTAPPVGAVVTVTYPAAGASPTTSATSRRTSAHRVDRSRSALPPRLSLTRAGRTFVSALLDSAMIRMIS